MANATTATAATTRAMSANGESPTPPDQGKRRRRRTVDAFLRPVYPISAILSAATQEEEQKARTLCSELLGYWLGHESKASLARRLGMPPIRVWQLSQRAMSGMVAALLRPPTGRRGAMPRLDPEVKALRKRVAELVAETDLQRRLIELLRTMPGNERREIPKEERDAGRPRRRRSETKVGRGAPAPGPGALPETSSPAG